MPAARRKLPLSTALKPPNNMLKTTPLACRICVFRSYCHNNAHTCTTIKPSSLALRMNAKLHKDGRLMSDGKLLVPDEADPPLPCPPPTA